jgi:hypothetical protein
MSSLCGFRLVVIDSYEYALDLNLNMRGLGLVLKHHAAAHVNGVHDAAVHVEVSIVPDSRISRRICAADYQPITLLTGFTWRLPWLIHVSSPESTDGVKGEHLGRTTPSWLFPKAPWFCDMANTREQSEQTLFVTHPGRRSRRM